MPSYRNSALSASALQAIIDQVVADTDKEGLAGLALMGSYASGTATAYSDVDLVCFRTTEAGTEHFRCLDHTYVVISGVALLTVDTWFTEPELATEFVGGLRAMRPVFDPHHILHDLRERANNFVWTTDLEKKARAYTTRALISFGEEVLKGMAGRDGDHPGRLLNAVYGLALGLPRVIRVRYGYLITSDNDYLTVLKHHFPGEEEKVGRFLGLTPAPLTRRLEDGFFLYCKLLEDHRAHFSAEQRQVIECITSHTFP